MSELTKNEMRLFKNNQVTITGEIVSDFRYSHEAFGEKFYLVDVSVNRLSTYMDTIPLMVSEDLIDIKQDYIGLIVRVNGQFRSYNQHEDNKSKLILSVFVQEMRFVNELADAKESNQIFLDGYICKVPNYRKTPLGREITDILIAVNRNYGKSDYIPCICWRDDARDAANFAVGDRIQLSGRIQSREYTKKFGEESQKRVAYEVSVKDIERLEV